MKQVQESSSDLPNFEQLWDYNKPAETETKFRELLPNAEQSNDRAYHAVLLTQIARTRGLQRAFEDAHKILDEADSMIKEDMIVPRIRYALERGRVFNSSNKKESSMRYFEEAFSIAQQNGEDFYAVDAAHMMGIAAPPADQLTWNQRALKIAESSKDERAKKWLGALYNNIGWTQHDLQQYDQALYMFEKGLKWREERKDEKGTFIAKWTVARCYRSLEREEEAIALLLELKAEMEQPGKDADGYVYEELGENYLKSGKVELSKKHFSKAYEILSKDQWLQANEAARLSRMDSLSR